MKVGGVVWGALRGVGEQLGMNINKTRCIKIWSGPRMNNKYSLKRNKSY